MTGSRQVKIICQMLAANWSVQLHAMICPVHEDDCGQQSSTNDSIQASNALSTEKGPHLVCVKRFGRPSGSKWQILLCQQVLGLLEVTGADAGHACAQREHAIRAAKPCAKFIGCQSQPQAHPRLLTQVSIAISSDNTSFLTRNEP